MEATTDVRHAPAQPVETESTELSRDQHTGMSFSNVNALLTSKREYPGLAISDRLLPRAFHSKRNDAHGDLQQVK
jgi:hypothetical protein